MTLSREGLEVARVALSLARGRLFHVESWHSLHLLAFGIHRWLSAAVTQYISRARRIRSRPGTPDLSCRDVRVKSLPVLASTL